MALRFDELVAHRQSSARCFRRNPSRPQPDSYGSRISNGSDSVRASATSFNVGGKEAGRLTSRGRFLSCAAG